MRRFVLLWAVLGAVAWTAGTAVEFAGFRRFDWTFEAFCEALLAPAAQAAAIAAVARRGSGAGDRAGSGAPVAVRALLAADVALAALSLAVPRSSPFAASRPSGVVAAAIAAQAALAGLLALALSAGRAGRGWERFALAGAGLTALAASAAAPTSLARLAARVILPRAVALVRLVVLGLGAFVVAVLLLLVTAKALSSRSSAAARFLDAATAALLAAGAVAALQFFRFPRLLPPWDGVVRAALLAAAGLALAAFLTALGSRPGKSA